MKKYNEPCSFFTWTANTPTWVVASGTPVAIHGYTMNSATSGDGIFLYSGNEATGDPIIADQVQGGDLTAGKTVMFTEPITFPTGCYIFVDASTVGSIFFHKI